MRSSRSERLQSLRATAPLRLGSVVLIPVQRVRVESWQSCGGMGVHASAEARAIVVRENGHWSAFELTGAEIALQPLLEEAIGLAQAIEGETRGEA